MGYNHPVGFYILRDNFISRRIFYGESPDSILPMILRVGAEGDRPYRDKRRAIQRRAKSNFY